MSDYVSKENYWRIFSMYIDLGTEILSNLFLFYIKKSGHKNVSTFFNNTEIKDKLIELKKKKVIENHEFRKVSAPDPNLGDIDITLMIKLITNLLKNEVNFHNVQPGAMDTTVGADLYRMRKFRNKLVHIPKAELCTSKFECLWKKIDESMLRIAGIINDDEKRRLSNRIAEYRDKHTNAVEKEKMCEILDDWKKQYESLKEKVKDLFERMFSFDLLLKSAPKRYIRYLKLLFECGMLTLLGILKRELLSEKQTLTNILNQHKDTLTKAITNDDDVNQIYPPDQRDADPTVWSLSLLATVILNTFKQLNEQDKSKIEDLKHAADENQIREKALMLLLETEYLLKQTSKLVHVITCLAFGIDEASKAQCFQYLEQYPDLEIKDDVTIEKYLKELRKQGETVIGLDELHKELISDLRAYVRQMCDSSAVLKGPKEIQIKIATLCEDEKTEHLAEETIENVYREISSGSTVSLNQSSHPLTKELQKLINSLSSHPDVKLSGIKRNCITLLITCSSYESILHIIDGMDLYVDKFCDRISDELSYLYGEVVVFKGNLTFESIYNVLTMQSSEQLDKGKSGLCITLESNTLKGIQHVIATLGDYETKRNLSEEESFQSLGNVAVLAFPYISELPDLFDGTESEEEEDITKEEDKIYKLNESDQQSDSKGSSSLGRNEDETEEMLPCEMGNKVDNGNKEEQVDSIINKKCTLVHADETDKEVVRGHADDEKKKISVAQHLYDEKMKEYSTDKSERNIKARNKDVILGEERKESELEKETRIQMKMKMWHDYERQDEVKRYGGDASFQTREEEYQKGKKGSTLTRYQKESFKFDGRLIQLTGIQIDTLGRSLDEMAIGRGTFGQVYRSNDSEVFGIPVAVKKIPTTVSKRAQKHARMEMMAIRLLNPFILPLIAFAKTSNGETWFITPYFENGDLKKAIKDGKASEDKMKINLQSTRVRIALHIALAIKYIHTEVPNVRYPFT